MWSETLCFLDTHNDVISTVSSVLLVFVTGGLVYLGFVQDKTKRKQLRAYLAIDEDLRPGIEQGWLPNKKQFLFHASVKNYGITPAYKVRLELKCEYLDYPLKNFTFPDPQKAELGHSIFQPNDFMCIRMDREWKFDKTSFRDVFKKEGARKRWFVYGYVVYLDTFGKRHHTTYCAFLVWHRGIRNKPSWMAYHEYNDAN